MPTVSTARTKLYMELVLEQTCLSLPRGGDHELRVFVARRLSDATSAGKDTLGELEIVARKALADYEKSSNCETRPKSSGNYAHNGCHQAAE